MESQFRLTEVLGFGIPYVLYQKLCAPPYGMGTSPTLSGISTFSNRGSELFAFSAHDRWYQELAFLIYSAPEVNVATSGVHLSNTFRYFYS